MNDEARVRVAAFNITSRFEGGGYHTYQNYDSGIISYGRFQFTLASGTLGRIVDLFLAQSGTDTAQALREYQARIQRREESLRHDLSLRNLLIAAASEPVMQDIQDQEATSHYWDSIKQIAIEPRGLQTPLAYALLFDIGINFGVGDGFLRMAENDLDVPTRSRVGTNGITEERLITRVVQLRKISHDRQAARDNLPGLRVRGDFWVNLVKADDWQLMGDSSGNVLVKGVPIQVRNPEDGNSEPELNPTKFYITPTDNRVRVRAQPINGAQVASLSIGDIAEVIEPYETGHAKIGVNGEWINIRTFAATEGFAAAWFFEVHREPTSEPIPGPIPLPEPIPDPDPIPTPEPEQPVLYITPTEDRIRIRAHPVNGEPVGVIGQGEIAEVLDPYVEALPKVGVEDNWLHIRTFDGIEGHTAAWFFRIYEPDTEPEPIPGPTPKPEPEPEPLVLYITPTDDHIRVRSHPVNGEPVGVVSVGEVVEVIDPYMEALPKVGEGENWLHIRTLDGIEGYVAAWFFRVYELDSDPIPTPQPPKLPNEQVYVTPTEDRIRIRSQPIDGDPVDMVSRGDLLQLLNVSEKGRVGIRGEWIHVLTPNGIEGYTAAWFFQTVTGALPRPKIDANLPGINLDFYHPLGRPNPNRLGQMGWLRFPYNVSLDPTKPVGDPHRHGNTDIEATRRRYQPMLEAYARAGHKILLVFTHQTFGEGAGYRWDEMNSERWRGLSTKFAAIVGRIAAQYAGKNIVHAYQIWNEMDAHSGARASVPLPPADYANLLAQSIKAIRAADPNALVITGGHASGPGNGDRYAEQTLKAMPPGILPDGIALHPYGRGDMRSDPKYRHIGNIDDAITAYARLMPGTPVWITEWGVLDAPHENPEEIARYAQEFIQRIRAIHNHKVAASIWFAWGQGMDNGYGLVDPQGNDRGNLTNLYTSL